MPLRVSGSGFPAPLKGSIRGLGFRAPLKGSIRGLGLRAPLQGSIRGLGFRAPLKGSIRGLGFRAPLKGSIRGLGFRVKRTAMRLRACRRKKGTKHTYTHQATRPKPKYMSNSITFRRIEPVRSNPD